MIRISTYSCLRICNLPLTSSHIHLNILLMFVHISHLFLALQWMCCAIVILLIVALIIVMAVVQ